MKQYFALGAYTEPILFGTGEVFQGKGKGIAVCALEQGRIYGITEIPVRNPSFLCIDEGKRMLYAVNEMKEYMGEFGGGMTAFSYDEQFKLTERGTWNTGGTDPCHIAMAPDGGFLAISNFANGSVTTFPLDGDGQVQGGGRLLHQHVGSSVHPLRQKGPHAHSCVFSPGGDLLYVPDLGIDRVVAYRCGRDGLAPAPSFDAPVPPGSGPRYGEFSRDGAHFYLIDEISSQVMHFAWENGRLRHRLTVNTLPADYAGSNICSDLHLTPDGTKLYASNRGHDSIVCYGVGADGDLTFRFRQSCGGRTPRNFAIDPAGESLLVGNQDSDEICVFQIGADGALTETSRFATGSPVCIRFFAHTSV